MTRVRKVAAVSLMTSAAAAAIAFGLSRPASAVEACPPLASATINAPTGTVAVGSTVHVSAQINGLMLLEAHLQVSGQGLDEQVGKSVMSGSISGNVTVAKAGTYTLAVVGNGTKCTYTSTEFKAEERATTSPTPTSAPGKSPQSAGTGSRSAGKSATPLVGGAGGDTAGGNFGFPLNGASPYSLPQVAPDGSVLQFTYPTPEPQVASPPAQPQARNVSATTPIKWGQSLAVALVLLVISAHLGMWSRRQRLAAEAAHATSGGSNRRRATRKRPRESATVMAATGTATATKPPRAATKPSGTVTKPLGTGTEPSGRGTTVPGGTATAPARAGTSYAEAGDATPWTGAAAGKSTDAATEPISKPVTGRFRADDAFTTATAGTGTRATDSLSDGTSTPNRGATSAEGRSKRSGGRGYRGRRRRS